MQTQVSSGPIWNPAKEAWEDGLVSLPTTSFGTIVLVPKILVRHRLVYDAKKYFTHFLLPEMQLHEKRINSGLVHTLKDGRTRVTKKSLIEKFGADKLAILDATLRHPDALDKYRSAMERTSQPISHQQLAETEKVSQPNFTKLLEAVTSLNPGLEDAPAYENAIEALLTAMFFPSLTSPKKQQKLHEGRKRIDITYVNTANEGFFHWAGNHYPAAHIFVECKNYGKEVGNPELDQLAGRFGPTRGRIGLLICRAVKNEKKLAQSCADTAYDDRGYIIHLTDLDLSQLVKEYTTSKLGSMYPLLREKFNNLVM
jgi:hypothetical protein